jgi:hypothetical protein
MSQLDDMQGPWRRRMLARHQGRPAIPIGPLSVTPPAPPKPWPRWARWLAQKRIVADQGVGDTLARLLDPRGGKTWKRWYQALTGHPCGCEDRQRRLNLLFPYPPKDLP